jgi:hypothetical protein
LSVIFENIDFGPYGNKRGGKVFFKWKPVASLRCGYTALPVLNFDTGSVKGPTVGGGLMRDMEGAIFCLDFRAFKVGTCAALLIARYLSVLDQMGKVTRHSVLPPDAFELSGVLFLGDELTTFLAPLRKMFFAFDLGGQLGTLTHRAVPIHRLPVNWLP